MTPPVSRRRFAASLAAGAAAGAVPSPAPADDPREPLVAPKPPGPKGLEAEAELLFEVLLSRFPESRVAAKRAEITRQLWAGAYYGRVLADAGLTNADGPGPLWAAYRADLPATDRTDGGGRLMVRWDFGLGVLLDLGPAAAWMAVAAYALRRCVTNTPGARPILAAAALQAAWHLVRAAMAFAMAADLVWNGPGAIAANAVAMAGMFFGPPLLLWGLWSVWRGYDDAAAGTGDAP